MDEYKYLTKEGTEIVKHFPTLSCEDLERANDLFRHYIFYRTEKNGDRILHTSCCHRNERYEGLRMIEDSTHQDFMCAGHNDSVTCPYCGRSATLKNIGKSGKRKNLKEYRNIVFLHTKGNALYAQAYWAVKDYEDSLDGEPKYSTSILYRFCLGQAQMFYMQYGTWCCRIEQERISRIRICEPFATGIYGGHERYHVIGLERLAESSLRYCQYDKWKSTYVETHSDMMKYLTLYCVYPKQVEMLMKAGVQDLVSAFLYNRKKNAFIFRWEETNPVKAFGLTKQELKEFLAGSKELEVLHQVKKLHKHEIRQSITEMDALIRQLGAPSVRTLVTWCLPAGLRPQKVLSYLEQYTGGCHAGGYRSIYDILHHWSDYMDAAKAIGYDVTNERVTMPRDLQDAHDTTTAEYRRQIKDERERQEAERNAALRAELEKRQKEYGKRREKLQKKYAMISDGLFIRVPKDSAEIIAEGQTLQHCVAGYADRHTRGTLTILFLRKVEEPDKPLCTIEMNGEKMVQIHGYKNEGIHSAKGRFAPPPEEVYSHFLEPWLRWIEAGSKRDKNGNPVIPAEQMKKEVQTA